MPLWFDKGVAGYTNHTLRCRQHRVGAADTVNLHTRLQSVRPI